MPAQPSSDGLGFFFDMPAQNGVHYVTRSFGARPTVAQTHMMGSLLPLTPVTFLRSDGEPSFPKLRNALVIHSEPHHRANASHSPCVFGKVRSGTQLAPINRRAAA
jgi:hypothetical protein